MHADAPKRKKANTQTKRGIGEEHSGAIIQILFLRRASLAALFTQTTMSSHFTSFTLSIGDVKYFLASGLKHRYLVIAESSYAAVIVGSAPELQDSENADELVRLEVDWPPDRGLVVQLPASRRGAPTIVVHASRRFVCVRLSFPATDAAAARPLTRHKALLPELGVHYRLCGGGLAVVDVRSEDRARALSVAASASAAPAAPRARPQQLRFMAESSDQSDDEEGPAPGGGDGSGGREGASLAKKRRVRPPSRARPPSPVMCEAREPELPTVASRDRPVAYGVQFDLMSCLRSPPPPLAHLPQHVAVSAVRYESTGSIFLLQASPTPVHADVLVGCSKEGALLRLRGSDDKGAPCSQKEWKARFRPHGGGRTDVFEIVRREGRCLHLLDEIRSDLRLLQLRRGFAGTERPREPPPRPEVRLTLGKDLLVKFGASVDKKNPGAVPAGCKLLMRNGYLDRAGFVLEAGAEVTLHWDRVTGLCTTGSYYVTRLPPHVASFAGKETTTVKADSLTKDSYDRLPPKVQDVRNRSGAAHAAFQRAGGVAHIESAAAAASEQARLEETMRSAPLFGAVIMFENSATAADWEQRLRLQALMALPTLSEGALRLGGSLLERSHGS